jgi:hypothetical protein
MTKYQLSLIFLLATGLSQSFGQKGSEIGVYYLPENTWIGTGVKNELLKNKITFAGGAGLSYTYNFLDKMGIQIGALYTSHNQKWKSEVSKGTDYYFTWEGKKRLDYLNIPVLLRFRSRIGPKIKSAFYGGLEASYMLKSGGGLVVYIDSPGGSDFYDLPASSNSYYKKMVVQMVTGWGLDFKVSKNLILNTALRLEFALTDAANQKSTYNNAPFYSYNGQETFKSRNYAIGLLMGVSYKLQTGDDLVSPSSKW